MIVLTTFARGILFALAILAIVCLLLALAFGIGFAAMFIAIEVFGTSSERGSDIGAVGFFVSLISLLVATLYTVMNV